METKEILIIVGILFIVSLGIEVVLSKTKKKRLDQLMYYLMENKFKEFDELLERKSTKFFVPIYNSIILRLNKAMILKDVRMVNYLIDEASKIRMKDPQKMYLYSKGFTFYLAMGEEYRCKKCYEEIQLCKDNPTKEYIEMVYDTIILKGYKYIDKAEKMMTEATGEDKENLATLLNAMYVNKG